MFSFTSMGGRIDKSINRGNAPYIFRLSGQNYHNISSLLPDDGDEPKFSQLYIHDTDNEIFNRQNVVGGSNTSFSITEKAFDFQIIEELKVMLDSNNALVKSYRQARNCFNENPYIDLKLRLIGKRAKDGRTYNLPEASKVAALVIGDFTQAVENRDIVVKTKSGRLERISELHPSYLSLQYPLLFPYGEDMYRVDILHRGLTVDTKRKRPMCTMCEFFAYKLQDRVDKFSVIHNAKRIFQQFFVDAYTMIESERLFYIRRQQTHLRSESFQNIQNANNSGKKICQKLEHVSLFHLLSLVVLNI
ncbi:putative helitron helicase-like domain-containing protein [Helianthus anomalus]